MFIQSFFNFTQSFYPNEIKYMLIRAQYSNHIRYGLLCCAFLHLWKIGYIFQRAFGLKERAPPERFYYIRTILLE